MYSVYSHGHYPHTQYFNSAAEAERVKWELVGAGYFATVEKVKDK